MDVPVADVSSSAGYSVQHTPAWLVSHFPDEWYVVYVRDGNVYLVSRGTSGWSTPMLVNANLGVAQNPHLAFGGPYLCVVWEDGGLGHSEVNARLWDGSAWSPEICLTADTVPSRAPVLAGGPNDGLVVWQEDGTRRSIQAKLWSPETWGSTETVSQSSGWATEPAVTFNGQWSSWYYSIAWTDTRDGYSEIYLRTRQFSRFPAPGSWSWSTETRLTNMSYNCRYPSIYTEDCCSDVVFNMPVVAFEYLGSGVAETWTVSQRHSPAGAVRASADDGVASRRPNLCGFERPTRECLLIYTDARYFTTWVDQSGPAVGTAILGCLGSSGDVLGTDTLSTNCQGGLVVGSFEGDPRAELMALWVEEQAGQPTLMSRRGSVVGCSEPDIVPPPSILLAPEGIPRDTLRFVDSCTGSPLSSWSEVYLSFEPALDAALTWDPLQSHPSTPGQVVGNDAMTVESIRGGGCSQAGDVFAMCSAFDMASVQGAKSPDVNGDCWVGPGDLAYVRSKAGTADFCADLDGSGLVDSLDVNIVLLTLGDFCSNVTGVPEAPGGDGLHGPGRAAVQAIGVTLLPNPCENAVAIRYDLHSAGPVEVHIVDPGGRVVRAMTTAQAPAGSSTFYWALAMTRAGG